MLHADKNEAYKQSIRDSTGNQADLSIDNVSMALTLD